MIFDEQRATNEDETYDPRKRDPLYARAGNSPIWELVVPFIPFYKPFGLPFYRPPSYTTIIQQSPFSPVSSSQHNHLQPRQILHKIRFHTF